MLPRWAKAAFYTLTGPLMRVNGAIYRALRAPRSGVVKVQLGPGRKNYLDGWINVDANAFTGKCDVWADLRNRLPFPDSSVDVLYSHHVIEHLPDLRFHFQEVRRCLKPGGAFRIGGPDGDSAIRKFSEGDGGWFSGYPDDRRSIGGRFENFIFCRQEHLTILTESWLREVAEDAGLDVLGRRLPRAETGFPALIDSAVLALEFEETPECPHTLILEGRKPAV